MSTLPTAHSSLPRLHPPLQETWKIALPSDSFIWTAPQIQGNLATVRCGHWLACVDIDRGNLQWQVQVGAEDIDNRICVSTPNIVVTASDINQESALIALSWEDGQQIWRVPVSGELMEYGVAISENYLYVLSVAENHLVYYFQQIDLHNGHCLYSSTVPSGANHALVVNEQLFFASCSFQEDDAGLYTWNLNERKLQKLLNRPTGIIRKGMQTIFAAVEGNKAKQYEVVALALANFDVLWSERISELIIDADGEQIAYLEASGRTKNRVVLRNELTGNLLWKSEILPELGLYVFFSGDLVCVQTETANVFLDRTNGKFCGQLNSPKWTFSWGGGMIPGCLILGHGSEVICYCSSHG